MPGASVIEAVSYTHLDVYKRQMRYTPCQIGGVCSEVVAMYVVLIAVPIIVSVCRTVQFGLIYPHVVGQIGMGVFHAFIDDGNDDRRAAAGQFPCLRNIDVGACGRRSREHFVAGVAVGPLARKSGIIEDVYKRQTASCAPASC